MFFDVFLAYLLCIFRPSRKYTCICSLHATFRQRANTIINANYDREKLSRFLASCRTRALKWLPSSMCNSQKEVPNGLHNCGSSTSDRYTPSTVRSSVQSRASSLGSLATRPPTKSSTRRTVVGGQLRDAVSKRLAKAAERHGGETAPDVRGEKMIFSARKSISATDKGFGPPTSDLKDECGGVSISCKRHNGSMME